MDKNKIIEGAAKLVAKGAYDKAVKEYQKVLDADPKDVRVLQKMGELYQKKNDNGQAATYFTRVAESYATDGFFLKAVALYKQVLRLNPNLLDVNIKLAELHQQLGLMSESMAFFQVVANAYDKAGDVKSSLATLKKMVDLDPDNVASRRKLAELYAREGMNREAGVEFKRAADYYKRNNRQDDYLQVAERISAIEPDNLVLARELATTYLQRGDQKRALGKLQICFKADSRDVETLQLLAQAFQGLGQVAKTLSVFKELAKVYQDRGRKEELNQIWAKIAELDPQDADLQARNAALQPKPAPRAPEPRPQAPARQPEPARAAPQPAARPAAPQPQQQAYVEGRTVVPTSEQVAPPPAAGPIPRDQLAKLLTETDVYVKYGLHDKALEHLRRIFSVDPENLDAHEKAYQIYASAGHHAQAADQLLNVLRLCTRRADVQRAQPYLSTILEQNPGHPEVPAFLSVLRPEEGAYAAVVDDTEADDAILVDSNDEEIIVADAPDEIIPSAGDDLGLLTATYPDADEVLADESLGDEPLSPMEAGDEPLVMDEPLAPEPYGEVGFDEPEATDPAQLVAEGYASEEQEVVVSETFELTDPAEAGFDSDSTHFNDPALAFAVEPISGEVLVDDEAQLGEDAGFTDENAAPLDLAPMSSEDEAFLTATGEEATSAPHSLGDEEEEVPTRASPIIQSTRHGTPAPVSAEHETFGSDARGHEAPEESFADVSSDGYAVDPETSFADPVDEARFGDETSSADAAYAESDHAGYGSDSSIADGAYTDAQSEAWAQGQYAEAPVEAAGAEVAQEDDAAGDECDEAEFFIDQGVFDEARDILENVLVAFSDHPRASALMQRLEQAERGDAAPVEEAPREIAPIAPPQVSRLEGEGDAFDLAAQLADEFGTLEEESPAAAGPGDDDFQYSVEEVFAEFKKGLEKVVKPEDVETHYDLGIAYREMGLIDDAIGEFRVAREGCMGKKKELDCLTMVGLLQIQKGDFQAAVDTFKEALASEHASGDTGNAVGYELAAAYEATGELGKALFRYQRVAEANPQFRDAQAKRELLSQSVSPEDDAPSAQLPIATKPAPARKVGYL